MYSPVNKHRIIRACLAALLLGLCAARASVGAEVTWLDVDVDGGLFDVRGGILIDAPMDAVYTALLDYDRFDELSDNFADSRYVEPAPDGTPRIYTRVEGCIWFFCSKVERYARIETLPNWNIKAIAEPELSDAELSIESWTLSAEGDGTFISYEHQLDPDFWVPPVIGAWAVRRALNGGLLDAAMRIEMLAQESAGTTPAVEEINREAN